MLDPSLFCSLSRSTNKQFLRLAWWPVQGLTDGWRGDQVRGVGSGGNLATSVPYGTVYLIVEGFYRRKALFLFLSLSHETQDSLVWIFLFTDMRSLTWFWIYFMSTLWNYNRRIINLWSRSLKIKHFSSQVEYTCNIIFRIIFNSSHRWLSGCPIVHYRETWTRFLGMK